MIQRILYLIVLSLFTFVGGAQSVFTSVANGDWDDASTWTVGAGAGGIEGITYPGPQDSVYINAGDTVYLDLTNNGNDYEFEGYMYVDSNAVFRCGSGAGNTDGFQMVDNSWIDVYGDFYIAIQGEGPGTVGPTERDFDIEDNSVFRVFNGAYLYLSDDWFVRDDAFVFIDNNICTEVDDDLQIEDNAFLCGNGGASIGLSAAANTLTYANGASSANICSGLSVYRGTGSACSGTGTLVQAGTGPAGLAPTGVADFASTTKNSSISIDVLDLGDDFDIDGDTLEIISSGSNIGVSNNSTTQGGTISININGTAANSLDDFINYTPPAGFLGTDLFSYIIEDEQSLRDTVSVTILVVECGTYIELVGSGANGVAITTLNFSDTTEIDSIVMESIYKGTAPASITFASGTQNIVNSTAIAAVNGGGGYFRTTMNAASSISATTTNTTTTQALVAYVYRNGTSRELNSVRDRVVTALHLTNLSRTINIPTGSTVRNILIEVPIAELNNDNRTALVEIEYGNVKRSLEVKEGDLGASLKLFTVVLEDVPGSVSQLTLTV